MNRSKTAMAVSAAAVIAAATILTSCKGSAARQIDACKLYPTHQAPSGEWVEWDEEPMDADPCDSDDLVEDAFGHKTSTMKPKVVSPSKPAPRSTGKR